ncbi:DUF2264 domain-containing protein [Catellatospora tritici]|uniref:DUF2264 domain-containing protein n=1 Tax=Catellatospora tritici TaxID=2851566 RepID=UPI001C2CEF20|nr:DUF2264 domain-containing protein [Catellatospora tritici]MBV1855280.1 DUF2264 domain-containing protein [Catellatospora tritici]
MPTPDELHGSVTPDRDGWVAALRQLTGPATTLAARGPHRQPAGSSTADAGATWFELVTRPLWGLAALAAGGGCADAEWDSLRDALTAAVDPDHDWYIGPPFDRNQRLVESAAVGYALAVAPHESWDPLTGAQRDHLAAWLTRAAECTPVDNNWHFFPVLAATGLRAVGIDTDPATTRSHLDRLEEFALADGWYADGSGNQRDYYIPFGFHYYGLQLAALGVLEPDRAERFRDRAHRFAQQFAGWFAADGAALPFGRSLGYRFAQGAFWSTLPVADLPALPWARVRGLCQAHLDWWWQRPILGEDGLLTTGYAYPNSGVVEQYLTVGSAYWSTKFFAALAAPADHPFWTDEPESPRVRPGIEVQAAPALVLAQDRTGDVTALAGQQGYAWARGGTAKAAKFAYSTLAGFSVAAGDTSLELGAYDSTLALSDDGRHWRAREDGTCTVDGDELVLDWRPWPDVTIRTRLGFTRYGTHRRTHEITTARALHTAEGGFCVPWTDPGHHPRGSFAGTGHAEVTSDGVTSAITDRSDSDERTGTVLVPIAGTNVTHPRTALPMLRADLPPGTHTLICLVTLTRPTPE